MPKKICLFVCLSYVVFMSLARSSSAIETKSYDELFKVLPGGVETLAVNRQVVEKAQKLVRERQLLRRRRRIKFIKPIEFVDINEKYISVAFDVQIKPRKKSVFTLLFEKVGLTGIAYPDTMYLSWIGEKDIGFFKRMPLGELVKSYQDMGVEDCRTGFVRSKLEKTLVAKANIGHQHSFTDIKGILSEKKIDRAIARNSELKAKMDLYVAALEKRIEELEKIIYDLRTTFKGVGRKGSTLVFNNMNVQITNGKGTTRSMNGRGNLIMGYNESRGKDSRKGSHNIVVGDKNNFSSFGGIVSGNNNTISGKYSFVSGGHNNVSSGDYSTITGGADNRSKGEYTSISGQRGRTKVGYGQNKHFKQK